MKLRLMSMLVLFLLLLAACGSNQDEAADNTSADEASKDQTEEAADQSAEEKNSEEAAQVPDHFPQLEAEAGENEPVVELTTNKGVISIKLFPEYAPKAVENFLTHSEEGYYEGVIFHRVIQDFMIQGGDPNGTGTGGESIYGENFEDEFSASLYNFRGALSMANSGPNTNGSQFFIVQNNEVNDQIVDQMTQANFPEEVIAAYQENGGTPWLDGNHTVFGQVIEGLDIVDEIAAVEVDANSKPTEDVVIEKIEIIEE
ncbi:peptidylprolyl isomerase [Jeotgalibacillus proteolyticus]|uniref:Peptidyl-prolyl cis-trans isomerase n=1 Tax=Jeotgalibacillus proteolyticus TaxID=2082395 RepID=A0A2S5GAS4_9BACL|nr:peptidylprolyl isomerase [Jeotgalibacillus proteolyticus]PPA69993.1 peptidylprolyl isomerase [Jeotgalibacillus proteolyticus]